MNKKLSKLKSIAIFLIGISAASLCINANAILIDQGSTIYDDDLAISWLNNAGLAGGAMTWSAAQSWIGSLNTANYLGFNNWRLPTSDACLNYGCSGSEMGHLFFNELGGMSRSSISSHHNANYGLFVNINDQQYWSGTEYASDTSHAIFFSFTGFTGETQKRDGGIHAWAVHDGAIPSIPEPETYTLMLAGLGLLGFATRHRKQKIPNLI